MPIVPLLKTRNYFIDSQGYVIKIENGKEAIVPAFKSKKSKEVLVIIDKTDHSLLYLMIQHFIGDIKVTDKIRFTVNDLLYIPLNSIKITTAIGKNEIFSPIEEAEMIRFRCDIKCNSANYRSTQKITSFEVFKVIKGHNYRCVYCGDALHPYSWHLDHFQSLYSGGANIFENLVASCGVCNIMKGAMEGNQFYAICTKIHNNYLFKDGLIKLSETGAGSHKPKNKIWLRNQIFMKSP